MRLASHLLKKLWFRHGTVRKPWSGPYRGIAFEICPQMWDRMIVFRSAYETEVTEVLNQLVSPGMVVYDVGAHVGVHLLYIAKMLRDSGTVVAFEAWPENYHMLQENVRHNQRLSKIVALNQTAVGDSCGWVGFDRGVASGSHHLAESGSPGTIQVRMISLDSYVEHGGKAPHLILVDVEGAELQVLRGAKQILSEKGPTLILEHHGAVNNLSQWLTKWHYQTQRLGARHLMATVAKQPSS